MLRRLIVQSRAKIEFTGSSFIALVQFKGAQNVEARWRPLMGLALA
jgi:hypothetical protein